MTDIHSILKNYWGFSEFRPLQEDIIRSVLSGTDTLALMPTGGGKSLCYQVPAMAKDGLCLVISPLIALMRDQVEALRKKNITAYSIFSGMSRKEVIQTLTVVSESNCKFLYVSPERLETKLFREYLPGMGVSLIAVDEAHCISQWGYDFRPPYLRIANLRAELPGIPILALTASATPEVQEDICLKLEFKRSNIFRQSFERPNISYSVFQVESKMNKLLSIIRKVDGTAIVYCRSRRRTKEISELLQMQGIISDYYHAGLTQEERNTKQEDWIRNRTRVIVCTNAFGMGIDKPDVRSVIHVDVPDCLENYYQEAGRAGRDGKMSYAVLLYDGRDIEALETAGLQRFPPLETIRTVYLAVSNYLQLESGYGQGNYYDFEMNDFLTKFKLDGTSTLYSLKALETDGWLAFNEQVFMTATIQFTITKERLYQFEISHPDFDTTIKTLLRSYEGIFDQAVFISEKLLAGLLKIHEDVVKTRLHTLNRMGIIEYHPQKDSPQVYWLRNRVRAEDLSIDMVAYEKRKQRFLTRLKEMIKFINDTNHCRGKTIGSYFGDPAVRECGICDNCLRRKSTSLDREEFNNLHERIIHLISNEKLHSRDLIEKLTGVKKEKAWKVIEFLQAENKIELDETGYIRLK